MPLVLVINPSVPAKTLPEFIAYAKANPGKINYASVGSGAATNVAGELFKEMAGIKLVNVPYRTSYIPDLLSGQVQAGFTPVLQTLSLIKAGKLRALAVTGVAHSAVLPDVPNAANSSPATTLRLGCSRRAGEYAARHHRHAQQGDQRGAVASRRCAPGSPISAPRP